MKKYFSLFFMVLLALLCTVSVGVSAYSDSDNQFNITIPEKYTVINSENLDENEDFLNKINFSKSGFKSYLVTNNIVLYAIDKTSGSELTIRYVESDFAKNINDIDLLNYQDIALVANKLIGDKPYTIVDFNETRYFKVAISSEDEGGEFFGSQYITVKNGKIYSLSITFPSFVTQQNAANTENAIIDSFRIDQKNSFSWSNFGEIITTVLLSIAIIVFLLVSGYVIYTFIRDARSKNSSNDVAPYVKIKRRKF